MAIAAEIRVEGALVEVLDLKHVLMRIFFWWQKEVTLQSLHLGDTPPMFSHMRALEQPRNGDSVVNFAILTSRSIGLVS